MTLISTATYTKFTHDSTTDSGVVTTALVDAQEYVEEYLRRPNALESVERTEDMYVEWGGIAPYNGRVYPKAWPVTDTVNLDNQGYTLLLPDNGDDNVILVNSKSQNIGDMPGPFYGMGYNPDYRTLLAVTYTGGYTAFNLPTSLQRAICEAAFVLTRVPNGAVPIGAKSVKVGDVAVTYGPEGPVNSAQGDLLTISTRQQIRRYRARLM